MNTMKDMYDKFKAEGMSEDDIWTALQAQMELDSEPSIKKWYDETERSINTLKEHREVMSGETHAIVTEAYLDSQVDEHKQELTKVFETVRSHCEECREIIDADDWARLDTAFTNIISEVEKWR